jgi:di/tricarboxylate transporter
VKATLPPGVRTRGVEERLSAGNAGPEAPWQAFRRGLLSRRGIGAVAGFAAALSIWSLPAVGQLDPLGQTALAIIAMAVVFWATDVINSGITAVFALGLLIAAGVPGSVALSGYASPAFWILLSVLFFGHAMDKTGLARRISYRILLVFRPSYAGILFAFLVIGFVLTLGIPSMTVRTAILLPIAWALVQALGLELPGRGAALIVLSTFEMAVLPGCALLTGALWGPYIAGLFATSDLPITWLGYAKVMALPTLVWCVLVLLGNMIALRPEPSASMSQQLVREEMRKLGRMARSELLAATIVAISILAWATQPWHRVPAEAIGMLALAALFATRVLTPAEVGTGIPWALALFVGGMLSVTTVITTYKISGWLGGYIVPAMEPFAGNPMLLVVAITAAVVAMRFVDPVGFITIAAFFLALVGFAAERGIPPLVLVGMILLPAHIFWFNYQNIWIVMTEGITKRMAYSDAHRFRLATVFIAVTLVSLWLAVLYWKLLGMI